MSSTNEREHQVVVDKNLCIGCGLCAKDCVGCDIEIVEGKAFAHGKSCISCGHCEAICPQKAINITGYEDEIMEFDKQVRLDPQQLLDAIRTRRSVRQFTDQKVSQDIVDMIFEAGRLAPTGTNAQRTSYVLLDEKMDECEAIAVNMFSKGSGVLKKFVSLNVDPHFFFKGAPVVIVVFGKDEVSATLAAQNMAFMAEAYGLGVLFSGFFTICVNLSSKIREIMEIPKKPKAVTTLVIGYPAVKYHRTAHRKPLNMKKA